MNIDNNKRAIGVFINSEDIEFALKRLKNANFPIDKMLIIGKKENFAGLEFNKNINVRENQYIKNRAFSKNSINGLIQSLISLGVLIIPGNQAIMLAGTEAPVVASALSRNPIATAKEGLNLTLIRLGIPEKKVEIYSYLVDQGYYLLIVNGDNREIAIAEMICRSHAVENWDTCAMSAVTSTILNRRYQYGVGLFFLRQDLEEALKDLRENDFPMGQVAIVAKNTDRLNNIYNVAITAPQYNFVAFDIPDDIAKHYNYRVSLGDYLVLLSGTAIQLAAARNILEKYQVQNYATFHPALVTSTTV